MAIDRLRFLQQEPGEDDDGAKPEDFNSQIAQAFQIRSRLDTALSKPIVPD
jgi:hypothetical protein